MNALNKIYTLVLTSCFLFLGSKQVKAQGEEKSRVLGYVFKTTSSCPTAAPTTANPASSPNAQGIIATDKMDVQIFPSCNPQSEVHITIDKNNPLHLVASANTMFPTYDQQGYYYSTDGGLTWSGGDIYPNSPTGTGMAGDPSTAFDANDNAFISTLQGLYQGFFDVSSANGVTWSNPADGIINVYFITKEKYTLAEVMVYDITGRLVVSQVVNANSTICSLNTEMLNSGLYLVTLSLDGVVKEKQKLVKQ